MGGSDVAVSWEGERESTVTGDSGHSTHGNDESITAASLSLIMSSSTTSLPIASHETAPNCREVFKSKGDDALNGGNLAKVC